MRARKHVLLSSFYNILNTSPSLTNKSLLSPAWWSAYSILLLFYNENLNLATPNTPIDLALALHLDLKSLTILGSSIMSEIAATKKGLWLAAWLVPMLQVSSSEIILASWTDKPSWIKWCGRSCYSDDLIKSENIVPVSLPGWRSNFNKKQSFFANCDQQKTSTSIPIKCQTQCG